MVGPIKLSNKLLLAEFLKRIEDKNFYMKSFFSYTGKNIEDSYKFYDLIRKGINPEVFLKPCDTTACVAGWMCVLWPELYGNKTLGIRDVITKLGISNQQALALIYDFNANRTDQIALLEQWAKEEVDSPVSL